ncbi:hypothetical protein [Thalassospira alkalitolerans]|uniref:hypothetical protein n=1 Tax=Thalassospira alkalitolerans TaxID=1293890 RepID=UPI0030ED42BC|tara:strand:+ start:15371 stop:15988 length:618 start_codon:yes stop_codon:yes gene_type:complete
MQGSKPVECEVLNVIQAAGIWPDCDDKTQLLQAITSMLPDAQGLPVRQYFTADGQYTVPENVAKVRVTVVGGGGGLNALLNDVDKQSENGGASSVTCNGVTILAEGGRGGWSALTNSVAAAHGDASGGDVNLTGQGAPGGHGNTTFSGLTGGAGGNGALAIKEFDVQVADVLDIVVGAGGQSDVNTQKNPSGNFGGNGYVILEWV